MTTPLFLLRCCEVGISIQDLDLVTIGLVLDMWTEKANDNYYSKSGKNIFVREADQRDMDLF